MTGTVWQVSLGQVRCSRSGVQYRRYKLPGGRIPEFPFPPHLTWSTYCCDRAVQCVRPIKAVGLLAVSLVKNRNLVRKGQVNRIIFSDGLFVQHPRLQGGEYEDAVRRLSLAAIRICAGSAE
jgi:hypothetical protein